jgi:hypothetical protein
MASEIFKKAILLAFPMTAWALCSQAQSASAVNPNPEIKATTPQTTAASHQSQAQNELSRRLYQAGVKAALSKNPYLYNSIRNVMNAPNGETVEIEKANITKRDEQEDTVRKSGDLSRSRGSADFHCRPMPSDPSESFRRNLSRSFGVSTKRSPMKRKSSSFIRRRSFSRRRTARSSCASKPAARWKWHGNCVGGMTTSKCSNREIFGKLDGECRSSGQLSG